MRNFKIIAIILVMSLIFAGCSMLEVNEERDGQTVIAKVGDEVLTKDDFFEMYDMYAMYGQVPADISEANEMIVEMLAGQLVDEKVNYIKAHELGCYDFTAEEQAELDEQANSILDTYISMYSGELGLLEENTDKSEEELTQLATDNLDEYLSEFDFSKQLVIDDYSNQKAQDKLYELITGALQVSEDEVKAEYDANLLEQRASFESGTLTYESVANDPEQDVYYTPEGTRQVQHILLSITDEDEAKIKQLAENGDAEGADAALQEALSAIKGDADAAYERAIAGEDFAALMEEVGKDPGMQSTDFYRIVEETQYFVPEFAQGLFELSAVGDISEPVASEFGYHIIKYFGDEPSGDTAYDNLHDSIYDTMLVGKKSSYYSDELSKWKESIDIDINYKKITN